MLLCADTIVGNNGAMWEYNGGGTMEQCSVYKCSGRNNVLPPPGEDYAPSVQIADGLDNGMWNCSVVVMSTFRRQIGSHFGCCNAEMKNVVKSCAY